MMLMFVGCDSGPKKLIGKWEGYAGDEPIEFENLDTMVWGDNIYDIEVSDGKIIVDYILIKEEMEYAIENNKLVLTKPEGEIYTFLKEGSVKSDEADMQKIAGEWGFIRPLFTFTESGELTIKNLPETEAMSKGKFVAGNGMIRYEPETDQVQPIYLRYKFDEDELILNYSSGEALKLVRVDTVEMREKAAEAYQSRYDSGSLEQDEISDLEDAERKEYIKDKVLQYLLLEMEGPSEESGKRGAIDFDVDIRNMSSRTIKYISFKAFVRNAVGDLVECTIGQTDQDKSVKLSITGPIAQGEAGGVGSYWPSAIFNSLGVSWEIADIDIEYMDGQFLRINGEDVLLEESVEVIESVNTETQQDISFNGIELFFTRSYGEILAMYGDALEIEKTDDLLFMEFSHPVTDFSFVFFSASPDQGDMPMVIMATPNDKTTVYNGLISGMTTVEVINVLGEPLSNDFDGENWHRLKYAFDKFEVEISCHETYGFLTFLLKNKDM